jgi:secreted PhoX family phosphatase
VQHPGEGGTIEAPISHWPGGGSSLPRPGVTSIWRSAEGDPTIGQ